MLVLISLVSVAGVRCANESQSPPVTALPRDSGVKGTLLEASCDDFTKQNNITRNVELTYPGSLMVSLCSNPATGFQWNESADINDPSVMQQYEHNYVSPEAAGVVGASGKDILTFNPLKNGTCTITMEYSRPWEGGEKGVWTYTIDVTVK